MAIFTPLIPIIPFKENTLTKKNFSLLYLKKLLFINASVFISFWYFAFIIDYFQEKSFLFWMTIYLTILTFSFIVALFLEKKFYLDPTKK